ncbi:ribosome biogenesis GTPase Der [Blattabacterium cuenoti]|uniref:ribosome biogenesis GTPase Der n=1 Tax=Blattabacterium cuenoti TaxID=1653831 RepID=UPI00163BA063|nr:ribosome biogenesis GTPase Der [Blattabacterium cuenoti]
MNYVVSIIGRPNVGKSTLFNRILGKRKAIVHATSGVTRDCIYGNSEWNGVQFSVVDTGGFTTSKNNVLEKEIKKKIYIAIQEAHVILFLVDIKMGILDTDKEIAQILRKCQKIVVLVVNKVDNVKSIYSDTDFFCLGFFNYYYISAINGSGTGELLDKLVEILKKEEFVQKNESIIEKKVIPRFSVVGRPNVGKSTLINSFLDKYHHIVTDISGTTRDSLDVLYKKFGYECILFDTPGVRKKSKIKESIEFYSTMRSLKTIEYTDVCFLMIDAVKGWEKQDMNIFRLVKKNYKGVIILINKWDLFHKNMQKNLESFIRKKIYPFYNVPILFISAKNKDGIHDIIPIADQVFKSRTNRLKTNILNKIMLPILKKNPPPSIKKNKLITIKYCTQLPSCTPKFIFFSNFPQYINKSYRRFVENKIRYHFDFIGVPIKIIFRKK